MKTKIYYFTGTGNSLWTARRLAQELGKTDLEPMTVLPDSPEMEYARIGLVFPVHIWGVPGRVLDFVESISPQDPRYFFAVAVNAGQVAATLKQLKKVMKTRSLKLCSGFSVTLPSNYIPWGGPGPEKKQQQRFDEAEKKIAYIGHTIGESRELPVEKGPLWQNILFSLIYRLSFSRVPEMDRQFWVDDKCNGCGICEKVCPAENITFENGRPLWNGQCEQCLACLQWCPQQAIQYGKKTPQYERYHHPEVKLSDLISR